MSSMYETDTRLAGHGWSFPFITLISTADSLLGHKTQIPCEEDEFQCSDVSKCLTRDLLCDGIPNCRNGEKEPLSCGEC